MPRSVHMPMRPVSASLDHPDLRSREMAELCALSPLQIRKANLIQVLLEDARELMVELEEPPDTAVFDWSEQQIRGYFTQVDERSHQLCKNEATRDSTNSILRTDYSNHNNIRQFHAPEEREFDAWFPGLQRSNTRCLNPKLRVLCFHNAGNAEDMFTSEGTGVRKIASPLLDWCCKNRAECLAVQLPGRAMRSKEPFLSSPQEAAQKLFPTVASRLQETPYIVIAHSMGAWVAYEFLCHARSMGLPMPKKAFLSAMPHPAVPTNQRPWRQQANLNEADFQDECKQWDVSPVLFSPSLWPAYHSIMRADFNLFDQYQFTHQGEADFAFPLTTFYGTNDKRVTEKMVRGWQQFTTGPFSCTPVQGNHLWPLDKNAKSMWLQRIVNELRELVPLCQKTKAP